MAVIGALVAELSANHAEFRRDMGKAAGAVQSSSARMNRALGKVDQGFGRVKKAVGRMLKSANLLRTVGVAAVAAATGLAFLVKRSIDAGDSIAKTAGKIGISTDALQEYRYALDLAGVSQSEVDRGLAQMVARVGEMKNQTGTLLTFLDKYNTELAETVRQTKTTDEALDTLVRAVADETDATQRAALARAAFGRAGGDWVNALHDGAEGFDRMRQRAHELGIVIEEPLLRSAEKAQDRLTDLGTVLRTNVTAAVLQNADAIAELAESFTEALPALISWGKKFGEFIGLLEKPIDERVEHLQKEIETLGSLGWNQNVLSGRKEELAGLLGEQAGRNKSRKEQQDRERARREAEERSRAAQRTRSVIEGLQLEHDQLGRNSVAQKIHNQLKQAGVTFDSERGKSIAALVGKIHTENEAQAETKRILEAMTSPLEKYRAELERLQDLKLPEETFEKAKALLDASFRRDHVRALDGIAKRLRAVGLATRDAAAEAQRWAQIQRQALQENAPGYAQAQADIDAIVARAQALASDSSLAGLRIGLDQFLAESRSVAEQMAELTTGAVQGLEDALVRAARTGKLEFADLFAAIRADLARITIREAITKPLARGVRAIFGGAPGGPEAGAQLTAAGASLTTAGTSLVGAATGLGGAAAGMTTAASRQTAAAAALLKAAAALKVGGGGDGTSGGGSPFAQLGTSGGGGGGAGGWLQMALQAAQVVASFFHSGGVVGRSNVPTRAVPLSALLEAPRYHAGGTIGLRPDERLLIGQTGETILPRGKRSREGDLHVQIQIHNQSGTPVTVGKVEQRRTERGIQKLLVDVVADDAYGGGDTTRALDAHRFRREGVVI